MIKYALMAAAAACVTAPAFAQAAPVEVELEGIFDNYTNATRTLTVMGMQVEVNEATFIHSPTTDRREQNMSYQMWFRGDTLAGRTRVGMLGGTAIVIGVWDPATNKIIANDVFTEPSENVALGVVTSSWCTSANCNAPGNYLRGNSTPDGAPGPAMIPITDRRMAAGDVLDEAGFRLNLAGVNMNGRAYAAEGYYGNKALPVLNSTGNWVNEQAFHYFLFGMANVTPELYLNKNQREVSILRTRCNVGDRFESSGHIHTTMNASGVDNDTLNANSGVISVQYTNAAGQLVRVNGGAATAIAGAGAVGRFRVRFDTNFCPETYTVRWLPNANSPDSAAYASLTDIGIDRLREDEEDDG